MVIGSEPGLRQLAFRRAVDWFCRAGLARRIPGNVPALSAMFQLIIAPGSRYGVGIGVRWYRWGRFMGPGASFSLMAL